MGTRVPVDFFRDVFLKEEKQLDEKVSLRDAKEQLFDAIKEANSNMTVKSSADSIFTPLDPERVKVAKLAIFFDTLNFLCE